MGSLVLSSTGRMMAVLCDGRTRLPEGEPRAYASYCGAYRIEGGSLITRVDAAANRDLIGRDQIRKIEMREGRLVLTPPQRKGGEQRTLVWERCGPP
jgi:hypothetical protein